MKKGKVKWSPRLLAALLLLLLLLVGSASSASPFLVPPPYFLDFDALESDRQVLDYYSGGNSSASSSNGPNYGIRFSPTLRAVKSILVGGSFAVANVPSPNMTVNINADAGDGGTITVDGGFTSLSFLYSAQPAGNLTFYEGPNGTGPILAVGTLQGGGRCDAPCGGAPAGYYGNWFNFTLQLANGRVARSVEFAQRYDACIDNMVIRRDIVVAPPTAVPTRAPTTKAPTSPTCQGTTKYWVYNATSNRALRQLVNNAVTCLIHPYNIQVRPCIDGSTTISPSRLPVTMKLARVEPDGRRIVLVHRRSDFAAPYFLFGGGATTTNDVVPPSPRRLPNGRYRLSSNVVGSATVTFTQSCCPKGKKGGGTGVCTKTMKTMKTTTTSP